MVGRYKSVVWKREKYLKYNFFLKMMDDNVDFSSLKDKLVPYISSVLPAESEKSDDGLVKEVYDLMGIPDKLTPEDLRMA